MEIANLNNSASKVLAIPQDNISSSTEAETTERYQVVGDRQGQVSVKDTVTGEVVRTFQMEPGIVVRETFLLNDSTIVAASQKDKAIFWELETGQEVGRIDQRIYGFSDDETRFWTYGSRGLLVYDYPELTQVCPLPDESEQEEFPVREGGIGPAWFQFSPDSNFLVIYYSPGKPAADEDYPNPGITGIVMGPGSEGSRTLIDIQSCQIVPTENVPGFTKPSYRGEFSLDSRFYELKEVRMPWGSGGGLFTIRLNLESYEFEQIFDRPLR